MRVQVVERTNHPKLREWFLQNKDLTLTTVLSQDEAYETSLREARVMEASDNLTAAYTAVQATALETKQELEPQEVRRLSSTPRLRADDTFVRQ